MNTKDILDKLYPLKAKLSEMARHQHVDSYQLPEENVSGRNLAAGRSLAYSDAATEIDKVIRDIINDNDE